jgi:DNA helicase-2/ATP-dependent DNA helicase PcrA
MSTSFAGTPTVVTSAQAGGPIYTRNQLRAIRTIDQNLQIVACAGAGKTQVVAERVAYILEKKRKSGIGPANIVAFTFTEKAGAELKDRITDRVRARLGDITGMAEMYVGTIHGYCLQLLQTHIPEYFKYSVLNEVQTRLLVDRASNKTGLSLLGLKRYNESPLYLEILGVLREGDIDASQLKDHLALAALEKFQNYLDEKRYLDYTEIMVRAVAALYEHADLRERIAQQVKYLIVDEYQDVNPLQESLIRTIHDLGANVCVVGDDDQTIYQWRGSNVENILRFADRYPNVMTIPIEENYRSSEGVVETARQVIERNDPHRLKKKMVSADSQPFSRGDLLCLEFSSPEEEARWIAKKAKSLIGTPYRDKPDAPERGLAPSDIAVLLRSVRRNGDPIVQALRDEGLKVIVVGMTDLFDTAEVQAAVALFEFMVKRTSRKELQQAWLNAGLGLDKKRLASAIALMEAQREWKDTKRWGVYSLQRTFLQFLEELQLREEQVPGGNGEIVFYNLGKFSQVISDFEQIHFQSDPQRKYESFADFLQYQAPNYYPEGWQDAGYAPPPAVQVMTVHQAKGMEWPVVFVPCLQRNRFPAKGGGGKGKWHVIPKEAVKDADRYDGSVEDERRLFYVALTRSQKYLFCSWAPVQDNQLYRKPSQFIGEFVASDKVLTAEPPPAKTKKLAPQPRREIQNIALSFSELKYFFECPYQFKLRFLYGFNPPLHEALGYGKSLHDALAEVHKRALAGDILTPAEAEALIDRHLNVPFAYPDLREDLRRSAVQAVQRYLKDNAEKLDKTEHVEQVVEINLGDGLVVNGRIDLIRRTDTKEIVVIDFKSTERAQDEDVSRTQLHIYALGYRELTGTSADLIEIYNLDEKGKHQREQVSPALEEKTRTDILKAGAALRANDLPRHAKWARPCGTCDLVGLCRAREAS